MKITIKELGHEPRCIILPIGLLANQITAGIAWSALSLAIHRKLPYRIPKELVKELRRTTLPPGIPLVEYENNAGTLVTVEL